MKQRNERLKSALRMGVVSLIVLAFGVGTGWYLWQDAQRMDANAEETQTIAEQVVKAPDAPTEGMDENLLRRIDFNALQAINSGCTSRTRRLTPRSCRSRPSGTTSTT